MSGDSYVPSAGEGAWVLESDNSILASDPSPFYAYVCCCCLHDQDNHDGVITHLGPDILECEVKWALESITTNKANGSDGIPVELFQILKDDAVKVLQSICQQKWKTQ